MSISHGKEERCRGTVNCPFMLFTLNVMLTGTNYGTPPNSEIICGRNVGTKVVCGMILFFEKKAMLKI